MGLVM